MKYVILIVTLLIIPIICPGVTRTVSLDGTQQYTSIQSAINDCSDGDSVLVYPGRYIENINLNGHSVSISSLYSINPIQEYIDNTIIDGALRVCLTLVAGEHVTLNGCTLVNNEQNSNSFINTGLGGGGGIRISNNSMINVVNCKIRNCISDYGGGISASLNASVYLSNSQIFDNHALYMGGGLLLSQGNTIVFDDVHLNSVFNNVSGEGMDIFIGWMEDYPSPINILLSYGSVPLSEPDNFFVTVYQANVNVSIQQGIIPQIDSDIYIDPNGSDDNTGLSLSSPYKTIKHAIQVINSNPDNPRTIHLAAGNYSFTGSGQIWPLNLKSHVRICGNSVESTILDDELHSSFFSGRNLESLFISDISFIHSRDALNEPIYILDSDNIVLKNLSFDDNQGQFTSGLGLIRCNNIIMDNLVIGNSTGSQDIATIYSVWCNNLYANNIISNGNNITDEDHNNLGFEFWDSDLVLRNSIIANNHAHDAYVFFYQTTEPDHADCNLDMGNVLIYNNYIEQCSWAFSPVYIQNRFQPVKINNCTFAGNLGAGYFTRVFAYADITDFISYNPSFSDELQLRNHLVDQQIGLNLEAEVSIRNSIFRTSSIPSDLPNLVTLTDNIFNGNPQFLGSVTDTLEVTQPEYYYLSEGSPCINTGVADTTGMNLPATDLAGNQRVWDGRIDMGCYEYGAPVSNDNPELPIPSNGIQLSLYPNPVYANGSKGSYSFIEFTLSKKAKEQPIVEVYNLKGQKVKSITLNQSYNDMVRKSGLSKDVNTSGDRKSVV
jgi:hypothetical protein